MSLNYRILEIGIDEFLISEHNYNDCVINTFLYDKLTYEHFFCSYMLNNAPCVLKNVSNSWECTRKWAADGQINTSYLSEEYGDLVVPVANCDILNFNSQAKKDMIFKEFMTYLSSVDKNDILYLKDWHLRRERPDDSFYDIPYLFASDWLNEYAQDKSEDDFMFVYIGPKKSWTPLHVDVYHSYSWSVNVVGKKKWILFPPGEENKLKDTLGNLPLLFTPEKYENIQYFEIIQEAGDAIFVPSGWHHQVENLVDTISINHNWINSCNIDTVFKVLLDTMCLVEKEIYDLKDTPDYNSHCQIILKSLFGMNYDSFVDFVTHIGNRRLSELRDGYNVKFKKYTLGIKHIKFDLQIVLNILNKIIHHPDFIQKCSKPDLTEELLQLKTTIQQYF